MLMTRCKTAGFALAAALALMIAAPAADAGKKDNTVRFAYD
jgi:ABC-type proline/glycine betaine transport system substrate-binding protein